MSDAGDDGGSEYRSSSRRVAAGRELLRDFG